MGARELAGLLGAALLLTGGHSEAGNTARLEPLDGTQTVTSSASEPANRGAILPRDAQPPGMTTPQGDFSSRAVTPFGAPLPPNQLTPPPVLPFNPNRSLMPSPSPSHPPNPARAETRTYPAPYSGGRLGR
jgi:hypothetical protein